MASTNDDLVTPLLGTQSCSPLVGRSNNCPTCDGGGIVGDERSHRSCRDCHGTGLASRLEQLIEEKRAALARMHAYHRAGRISEREAVRAEVAEIDDEIARERRVA